MTPRPLYPPGKNRRYLLCWRLGGLQSRSGPCGEDRLQLGTQMTVSVSLRTAVSRMAGSGGWPLLAVPILRIMRFCTRPNTPSWRTVLPFVVTWKESVYFRFHLFRLLHHFTRAPTKNPKMSNHGVRYYFLVMNRSGCQSFTIKYDPSWGHKLGNQSIWNYISISNHVIGLELFKLPKCRSQWPRGLRHEPSSSTQTLGSWVRIPLEPWMSVYVYSVCLVLCVGTGLMTSWARVQGVLPTLYRWRNWESGQGPTKGCRAVGR
jgi:hypothetical protein